MTRGKEMPISPSHILFRVRHSARCSVIRFYDSNLMVVACTNPNLVPKKRFFVLESERRSCGIRWRKTERETWHWRPITQVSPGSSNRRLHPRLVLYLHLVGIFPRSPLTMGVPYLTIVAHRDSSEMSRGPYLRRLTKPTSAGCGCPISPPSRQHKAVNWNSECPVGYSPPSTG